MKLTPKDTFGLIITFLRKNGLQKAADYIAKKVKYSEEVCSTLALVGESFI